MDPNQLFSPAAERNRVPILDALRPYLDVLPQPRRMLEVASGSGQHAAYFASQIQDLIIYPTDLTLEKAESVKAWAHQAQVGTRVQPLQQLDATQSESEWPQVEIDLIYCANMIHIAPWSAACGLFAGSGKRLSTGGLLVLYGPYQFPNTPLEPSNVSFDQSLRIPRINENRGRGWRWVIVFDCWVS